MSKKSIFFFTINFSIAIAIATTPAAFSQNCTGYVNATDGDDSNSGTIVSPFQSFEFAFNSLPSGSSLCVAAGEYFSGLDADGISLSTAGKSMDFVLNAFAGKTEIRFSESSFEIDVFPGTIRFRAGNSTDLVFGIGNLNSDVSGEPDLLNFLHTLRFDSGTVSFEGLVPKIERSVGVPGFVNPDNAEKIAPQSAVVELGGVQLEAVFNYENASRSYLFSGNVSPAPGSNLPFDIRDNRFFFDSESDLVTVSPFDISNGSIRFLGPGRVSFAEEFRLGVGSGSLEIAGSAGRVEFQSSLVLSGESVDRDVIQHAGGDALVVSTLSSEATSLVAENEISIRIASTGSLDVESFSTTPSGGGFSLLINIINDAGVLNLGNTETPEQLPGTVSNDGVYNLRGSLILRPNIAGSAVQNSSLINLNGFSLFQNSQASLINNGTITSPGLVSLSGPTTITGTGQWPQLLISNTSLITGNSSYSEDISIQNNGQLNVSENSSLAIGADLTASPGAKITLNNNSSVSVARDIRLVNSEVFLRQGSELTLRGDLDTGASVFSDRSGVIRFSGDGSQQISAVPSTIFPGLQVIRSAVHLPSVAGTGPISIQTGALLHNGQVGTLSIGGLSIQAGSVTLAADPVTIAGDLTILDGSLTLEESLSVEITGDLNWSGGNITLPQTGITFSGGVEQHFNLNSSRIIPGLVIAGSQTRILIDGLLELDSTLLLDEGRLTLMPGSILSVKGDVLRSSGLLSGLPDSALRLSGSSIQTISGFASTVLPSLIIEANTVLVPENMSIQGEMIILSGAVLIQSGSTIIIGRSLSLDGGILTLETSGELKITDNLLLTSGQLQTQSGTSLSIGGNFILTDAIVEIKECNLVFNGRKNQSFVTGGSLEIRSLSVLSAGTHVDFPDPGQIVIRKNIEVAPDAELSTGNASVEIAGDLSGAGIMIDGILSGPKDGIIFSGPATGTVNFFLAGTGIFGPLTIDLNDESDVVLGTGSASEFTFSGDVRFLRGGIDVAGRTVKLSSEVAVPSIERNLTSSGQDPGVIDGGWFTDSTGPLVFNPDAVPYDLKYSGELSLIYLPDGEFPPDQIRNITIDAVDVINSPAVFGVMLPHSVFVGGDVRIKKGALLRLDQFDITSTSSRTLHQIDGTIAGTGSFLIQGDASTVSSPLNSGMIETLIISNQAPSSPVLIQDIFVVANLDILGGGARISDLDGAGSPFLVSNGISVANGSLTLNFPVRVGSTESAGLFSVSNGLLRLEQGADLILGPESEVEIGGASSIEVVNSTPNAPKSPGGNGFLIFEGSGRISSSASIPRLRLAAVSADLSSDDLEFFSDITVTDIFDLVAGDVILGEYDLVFEGIRFTKAENNLPFDSGIDAFFGDPGKDAGRVLIKSASTLELNSDLQFFSARFVIAADPTDQIDVVSMDDTPGKIILFDRAFVMKSGTLNIGRNDIVLKAGAGPAFIANGGAIIAVSAPVLAERRSSAHGDPILFPYDDTRYGELILGNAGSTSIEITDVFSVPNLTIAGATSLEGGAGIIRVSSRLSYGRAGATFITVSDGRLRIGNGGVILRRGAGTISHPIVFEGEVDLFYDLDNGSVSGVDSEFGSGILQTSLELPDRVRNLGVMAGQVAGVLNVVDLSAPLSVTGTLSLFSGQLFTNANEISLEAGARLILDEVDEESPVTMGPGRLTATGPVDLAFTLRFSDLSSSDALIPEGTGIDSLLIELGEAGLNNPVDFVLHRSIITTTVRILAPTPGSSINLAGSTLSTMGDMHLDGGSVRSGSLARLSVDGDLFLAADAEVIDAVAANIAGTAHVAGFFDGLELRVAGDLNVSSPLGSSLNLIFSGSQQRLFAGTDLSIAVLEIAQQTAGPNSPSVTIDSNLPSITITILNNLRLQNGILVTGENTLFLPGSNTGFTRDVGLGDKSHILGKISRDAPGGSNATFVFPTGDPNSYRPLSLTFPDPLLTEIRLSVDHHESAPIGLTGLPLEFTDGTIVRGLTEYSWSLFSSVNFAQSQPVDIRVQIEQTGQTPADHRLIGRDVANIADAWRELAPENSVSLQPGILVLEVKSVKGILSPEGVQLGVGVPESDSFTSLFQFAHGDARHDDTRVSLMIGGQLIFSAIEFSGATNSVEFSLSSPTENMAVSVLDSDSGEPVADAIVQFFGGSGTFSALLSGPDSQTSLASGSFSIAPPSAGTIRVQPVNGSADLDTAELRDEQSLLLLGPVEPGQISSEDQISATNYLMTLTSGDDASFIESYQFDFTPYEGMNTHLMYSGDVFADTESTPLTARLILLDGSVISLRIVTGTDEPFAPPSSPNGLALYPNFPNPFNRTTTIRFDLPEIADIRVVVYDMLGRSVSTIDAGRLPAGAGQTISFDAGGLASGMYLYRLEYRSRTEQRIQTGKMLLVR